MGNVSAQKPPKWVASLAAKSGYPARRVLIDAGLGVRSQGLVFPKSRTLSPFSILSGKVVW